MDPVDFEIDDELQAQIDQSRLILDIKAAASSLRCCWVLSVLSADRRSNSKTEDNGCMFPFMRRRSHRAAATRPCYLD